MGERGAKEYCTGEEGPLHLVSHLQLIYSQECDEEDHEDDVAVDMRAYPRGEETRSEHESLGPQVELGRACVGIENRPDPNRCTHDGPHLYHSQSSSTQACTKDE